MKQMKDSRDGNREGNEENEIDDKHNKLNRNYKIVVVPVANWRRECVIPLYLPLWEPSAQTSPHRESS